VLKWGSDLRSTTSLRKADRFHPASGAGLFNRCAGALLLIICVGGFLFILFFAELPDAVIRSGQTNLHKERPASGNDYLKK
jgi:hypothetical protein